MNRDELLTELAMELAEWPVTRRQARKAMPDVEWSEIGASVLAEPGDGGQSITERHWLTERARLINKPSWDDAPGYAEWLAQDVCGTWFWYLNKPNAGHFLWTGHVCDVDKCTRGAFPAGHVWRTSLEQRPAETIPPEDTVEISELLLWDGASWPPPVGIHCLARNPYTEDGRLEKATVIHHSRKGAVVVEHDHGDIAVLSAPGEFRPIRPAEHRAVEALANVLEQYGIIPNPDNSVRTIVSRAIYDAIRDGEIPGIKLEGEA